MARHSGKNGSVKLGAATVIALRSWDIEETVGEADLTAAGDEWETHQTLQKSWSGNISMVLDHAAAGQTVRAGDSLAFEGYTETEAQGVTYYSGTISITSHGVDSPYDGTVTRTYAFKGNGALTSAVVPAP